MLQFFLPVIKRNNKKRKTQKTLLEQSARRVKTKQNFMCLAKWQQFTVTNSERLRSLKTRTMTHTQTATEFFLHRHQRSRLNVERMCIENEVAKEWLWVCAHSQECVFNSGSAIKVNQSAFGSWVSFLWLTTLSVFCVWSENVMKTYRDKRLNLDRCKRRLSLLMKLIVETEGLSVLRGLTVSELQESKWFSV